MVRAKDEQRTLACGESLTEIENVQFVARVEVEAAANGKNAIADQRARVEIERGRSCSMEA